MKLISSKRLMNVSILLISILITLLLSELIIRFLYKKEIVLFPRYMTNAHYGDFSIRCVRSNMEYKHRSIDGVFRFKTNNRGFRNNKDISYDKGLNEVRVLCLGDSHTEGYEVNQDETFSYVAEKILTENGLNATVVNAGVSGFSTAEELVFLENEGFKYKPDFVVLGFFGNDISDNIKSSIFYEKNDSLQVMKYEHLPGVNIQNFIYRFGIFHFLGENSYLYAFGFNTIWNHYNRKYQKRNKVIQTEYAVAEQKEYSQYEYKLTENIISRMYDFTHSIHSSMIILDIPQCDPVSSIPDILKDHFISHSDTLFLFQNMQDEYKKLSQTHLAHGHHHISAETHDLLGHKIADYIINYYKSGS